MSFLHQLGGHFWTVSPTVREAIAPIAAPPFVPWTTELDDPIAGIVPLTGKLSEPSGADFLVVIVHGLGGHNDRPYCFFAEVAAHEVGVASLRINVRGADRSGADIMHAGLTADIHAALRSPLVQRYRRVGLIGFSIGGHLSLKAAAEGLAENVVGVAAVSAPLDLAQTVVAIDAPRAKIYRASLLGGLNEMYAAWAERHPGAMSAAAVRTAKTIRQWDERVVVPRHGFADVADYYASQSVGPRLGTIRVPALYVGSRYDPRVPYATIRPFLEQTSTVRTHMVDTGGHVNFPSRIDVGLSERRGVAAQLIDHLRGL